MSADPKDPSLWISCSERRPTETDADTNGEVWWWIPRHASHGAQHDYWECGENATHWQPTDDYIDEQPVPPATNKPAP